MGPLALEVHVADGDVAPSAVVDDERLAGRRIDRSPRELVEAEAVPPGAAALGDRIEADEPAEDEAEGAELGGDDGGDHRTTADLAGAGAVPDPALERRPALGEPAVVGQRRRRGQEVDDHEAGDGQEHSGGHRRGGRPTSEHDGGGAAGEREDEADPLPRQDEADDEGQGPAEDPHGDLEDRRDAVVLRRRHHPSDEPPELSEDRRQDAADDGRRADEEAHAEHGADGWRHEERRRQGDRRTPQQMDPSLRPVATEEADERDRQSPHVPPKPFATDGPPVPDGAADDHGEHGPEQTAGEDVVLRRRRRALRCDRPLVADGHEPDVHGVPDDARHDRGDDQPDDVVADPVGEPSDGRRHRSPRDTAAMAPPRSVM